MKKISISNQIIIIFVFVLLISACAFTSVTLSRIFYIAEQETYSRLITYSNLINHFNPGSDPIDFNDMEVAFYKTDGIITSISTDINEYVSQDNLDNIINNYNDAKKNGPLNGKIKNYKGEYIYYVVSSYKSENSISIIFTNSLYVNNLVKNVSLQLILIFFIIIFLSIMVIAAWGNQIARRLHRIQSHILELPKTAYQAQYSDDGLDEVGELSRAVEVMREEIKENEKTKQEMLQNISHDFKTPIAVIKSYAEAQQDGMSDENSSKIIISQADILKHKVNRLLQYNSLEYLNKDKEFENVDMKEVIEEVICTYKFQTDLKIELDLTEDVFFKGYRENYYTVVDNIIDNAKRYAKSKIKIVLKKDRLIIYNDGEHIDEQFIKNSFKPYEKGSKGQFGLGMSIVKKTVEFFGMELRVKNEQTGVSFIITKS